MTTTFIETYGADARIIPARFSGKCGGCGREVPTGARIVYAKGRKPSVLACPACDDDLAPIQNGGASEGVVEVRFKVLAVVYDQGDFKIVKAQPLTGPTEVMTAGSSRLGFAVKGKLGGLGKGDEATVRGKLQFSARGLALSANGPAVRALDESPEALRRFLDRLENVGPVRSKAIMEWSLTTHGGPGEGLTGQALVLWVLENEPERLCEVKGIGPATAESARKTYIEERGLRDVLLWLAQLDLPSYVERRVLDRLGACTRERIEADPYLLVDYMPFNDADRVARKLGIERTDPRRFRAIAKCACEAAAREGHTWIPATGAMGARDDVGRFLRDADLTPGEVETAFGYGIDAGLVWSDEPPPSATRYATETRAADELLIAECLHGLARPSVSRLNIGNSDLRLFMPSEDQEHALETISTSKVSVLTGGPGCIDAGTLMQFETEGRRGHGGRWYTVEDAFHKFHRLPKSARSKDRPWSGRVWTLSQLEDGGINYNEVKNIVVSGEKEVFDVRSRGGRQLVCSAEHPFKVPERTFGADADGFMRLEDLSPGSKVVVRREETTQLDPSGRNTIHRREVHVPFHPNARPKTVVDHGKTYQYKLVTEARLVIEAEINDLAFDRFVARLQESSEGLRFLSRKTEVHHRDEDPTNNKRSNLLVVSNSDHARLHGRVNRLHFGNQQAELDEVVSITPIGKRLTYDLVMADPYRNYVAGGFIVHNSGKSTITRFAVEAAERAGLTVALCSLSAKAARRMMELTGREAATIHRLIGWRPGTAPNYNRDNPLHVDFLVVDEATLAPADVFARLLDAVPFDARVLLVGDVDQLPSVGPGAVFADAIESGRLPIARLTQLHRTAAESPIPHAAAAIRTARVPTFGQAVPGAKASTVEFIDVGPLVAKGADAGEATARVITRLATSARSQGDVGAEVVVLCPQRNGKAGVEAMNQLLRGAAWPNATPERAYATRIRGDAEAAVGDRVIHVKNDYEIDVMNGEVGFVTATGSGDTVVQVEYDDPLGLPGDRRVVAYARDQAYNLELAYALTVHKSQGSEYDTVFVPVVGEHTYMLTRKLLYTAVTRAKRRVVLVGTRQALEGAIRSTRGEVRRTLLPLMFDRVAGVKHVPAVAWTHGELPSEAELSIDALLGPKKLLPSNASGDEIDRLFR